MRWGVISWQPHPDCGGQARPFPAGKFGRGRGVEEDPVFSGVRGKAAALFTCSGAASAPADALPDLQALRRRSEAARGWDGRRPDRTRPPPARRGGGRRAAEEEGGIGGRRYLRGAGASSSAPSLLRLLRAPRHHLRTAQRGLGAEGSGGVPGRMPPFYLPAAGEVSKAEFLPPSLPPPPMRIRETEDDGRTAPSSLVCVAPAVSGTTAAGPCFEELTAGDNSRVAQEAEPLPRRPG